MPGSSPVPARSSAPEPPASPVWSGGLLDRPSPRAAAILDRTGVRPTGARILVLAIAGYVATTAAATALGTVAVSLEPIDRQITGWFVERRSGVATDVASLASNLSDTWTVLGVAFGSCSVLLLVGLGRRVTLLVVGLSVEITVFLSTTYVVDRPRPDVVTTASLPATPSFPSGHVAAAVTLYGGLVLVTMSLPAARRVRAGAVAAAVVVVVLVGWSRVYEGLHHPSDVAGGVLVGLAALATAIIAARAGHRAGPPDPSGELGR